MNATREHASRSNGSVWVKPVEQLEGRTLMSGGQTVSFRIPVDYATTRHNDAIVAGDFNGDRRPDLVVSDSRLTQISFRPSTSAGTFGSPVVTRSGAGVSGIVAGDFNRDGKLDVVTASESNGLFIHLGNGNGTFRAYSNVRDGNKPTELAAGDFNRDGKLDLVAAGVAGVSYFQGNGAGGFAARRVLPGGRGTDVAVADFNRDGNADVAVSNFNINPGTAAGRLQVFSGNGDGTFNFPEDFSTGSREQTGGIVATDLNEDGRPDLAVLNGLGDSERELGTIGVLRGDGFGGFAAVKTIALNLPCKGLIAADFNRDGSPELVVTSSANTRLPRPAALVVLPNLDNGTGNFGSARRFSLSSQVYVPTDLVAADFNGDGALDAATMASDFVSHFRNITPGSISGTAFRDSNGNGRRDAGEAALSGWTIYIDADNDGRLDTNERRVTTDTAGNYTFGNLAPGTYRVREVLKSGFTRTAPSTGVHLVTLTQAQVVLGKNFGNR